MSVVILLNLIGSYCLIIHNNVSACQPAQLFSSGEANTTGDGC